LAGSDNAAGSLFRSRAFHPFTPHVRSQMRKDFANDFSLTITLEGIRL